MRYATTLVVLALGIPLVAHGQEPGFHTQLDVGSGLLEIQARLARAEETERKPRVQVLFAREDTLLSVDIVPARARALGALLRSAEQGGAAAFDISVRTSVVARSMDGAASLEFVCTDDIGCVPEGPLVIVANLSEAEREAVAASLDSAAAIFAGQAAPAAVVEEPVVEQAAEVTPTEPAAPSPGRLTVNAIPFAMVELDGRRLGDTPQVNVEVTPGDHTVRFIKEGYRTEERQVTVASGEVVRVVVRLQREGE
ncbi:MAG TPA: PEGA domain-containing protein [Gemmatimonadales bacterium]|jgi:hypothetical protein